MPKLVRVTGTDGNDEQEKQQLRLVRTGSGQSDIQTLPSPRARTTVQNTQPQVPTVTAPAVELPTATKPAQVIIPERFQTITDQNVEDYLEWVQGQAIQNNWTSEQFDQALGSTRRQQSSFQNPLALGGPNRTYQTQKQTPEGARALETIKSEWETARGELAAAQYAVRNTSYRPHGDNTKYNEARRNVTAAQNKVQALAKEMEDTYGYKPTTLGNMAASMVEDTKSGLANIGGVLADLGKELERSASEDVRRAENAKQHMETYAQKRDAATTEEDRAYWQKLYESAENQAKVYSEAFEAKHEPLTSAAQTAYQTSDELDKKAQTYHEGALYGKSDAEKLAVDAGMFLGGIGANLLENAALPGLGLFARGVDAAGRASRETRQTKGNAQGYAADQQIGQYGLGNIDLYNRPVYQNDDGTVSTVDSITIEENGKYILLPTIAFDAEGKPTRMTDEQAIARYHRTGEMLGEFANEKAADDYANALHYAQEFRYASEYSPLAAAGRAALAAGGVAVGAKLSEITNSKALEFLRDKKIQNLILPNVGLGGISGLSYATGETAMSELGKAITDEHYTPDWTAIGQAELNGFVFGALSRFVSIAATSGQNKAAMQQELDELKRRYEYAKSILDNPGVSTADKARGAQSVMDAVDGMNTRLDDLYIVGAQKEIDAARGFLSAMKAEMEPYTTATNAASIGPMPTGLVPTGGNIAGQAAQQQGAPTAQATGMTSATSGGGTPEVTPMTQNPTAENERPRIMAPTAEQGAELPTASAQEPTAQEKPGLPAQKEARQMMNEWAQRTFVDEQGRYMPEQAKEYATSIRQSGALEEITNFVTAARQAGAPENEIEAGVNALAQSALEKTRAAQKDIFAEPQNNTMMNGGLDNGGQYGDAANSIGATAGASDGAGANALYDGDGRRDAGVGAGRQDGSMAEGGPRSAAEQSRAASARQNAGKNLPKESLKDYGFEKATETKSVQVMPEEMWDDGLRTLGQTIKEETGLDVTFFLGRQEVAENGTTGYARAIWAPGKVAIQADNLRASPEQLWGHEYYHDAADRDPGLRESVRERIEQEYSPEELRTVYEKYLQKLRGIINLPEDATPEQVEEAINYALDEVFGDANGALNWFGYHADQFHDSVRGVMTERGHYPNTQNAAATDRMTGPPERFSINNTRDMGIREQLKEYRAGRMTRYDEFYYGSTPRVLGDAGLEELPLVLSQSDYKKSRDQKHSVPNRAMTRLTELMEDPILAWENGNEVGILTKDVDADGKPLLIGIHKNVMLDNERVNRIKSAYGLDNPQAWMDNQRRNGGTLHVFDENRAASFLNDADDVIGRTGTDRSADRIAEGEPEVKRGIFDDVPKTELPTAAEADVSDNDAGNIEAKDRFSLDEPVEMTKTLVAQHNLDDDKMRRMMELGAIPSPSIAVVRADQGHAMYGPYSIVFPRSTIDPEADRRNKVYGSDAWTPTHSNARVESEVKSEAMWRIDDRIKELSDKIADGIFSKSSTLEMFLGDETEMTLDDIAERLASEDAVRAAYLAAQGETLEPVKRAKEWNKYGNDYLRMFLDQVGPQRLAQISADLWEGKSTKEALGKEYDTIQQIIREYYANRDEGYLQRMAQRKGWTPEEMAEQREKRIDDTMAKNVSIFTIEDFAKDAWAMYEDGGQTKGENDVLATSDALSRRVNDKDVQAWIRGELDGLLGERGIWNGKEIFDTRGNRRSFKQLHWPVTAENIVRAMNLANDRGAGYFGFGAPGMHAVATTDFRNVGQMHAEEGRLRQESEEEHAARFEALDKEIEAVVDEIRSTTKHHADNTFEENEIIGDILMEAAQGKRTPEAVQRAFQSEGYAIKYGTAEDIVEMYNHAAEIPTGYFEAKPKRVVPFSEALALLEPSDAPEDIRKWARDTFQQVIPYEAGNEDQRRELINSIPDARFSIDDVDEAFTEDVTQEMDRRRREGYFYSKLEREVENFRGQKMGAASVMPYLKGHGVKDEEIKWSGIEQFLEGKRSVDKDELLDFLRENRLDIEDKEIRDEKGRTKYTPEETAELDRITEEKSRLYDRVSELWKEAYNEIVPDEIILADNTANALTRAIIDRHGGIRGFTGINTLTPVERELYRDIPDELRSLDWRLDDIADRGRARSVNTSKTHWNQYKLDGGEDYRELLFKMPGSDYTNDAMQAHWGERGVLAHARVQDFKHGGEPVLFIDEIQSDWHNAGQKSGYQQGGAKEIAEKREEAKRLEDTLAKRQDRYYEITEREREHGATLTEGERKFAEEFIDDFNRFTELSREVGRTPDAPFQKTYHEYVLKDLLRRAAEDGYKWLAWTPGWMQEERWSSDYAEGYRIEYDQDIPKFLKKYGKQWGAQVRDIDLDELANVMVPAIDITDRMKNSILTEGQPRFSIDDDERMSLRLPGNEDERVFYAPGGVEVIQNPTAKEYEQMREEVLKEYPQLRGTGEPLLRRTFDEQGNEYYWRADKAMHARVEPAINRQFNTRTSQQWEWWKKPDKDDYPTRYSIDDGQKIIPQSSTEYAQMKREGRIEDEREKTRKPVKESLPTIAKKDLRQNLLNLFSIPAGQRTEMGNIIDRYADRMLRDGKLTQKDMDDFFDRMYAEGVMTVAADDFYQDARSTISGRRIYVNDSTKEEFGDEWNDFRRRAFAAGLYLVNDRTAPGVDVVNAELSSMMPGVFDEDTYDMKGVLERAVQLAEEGKDQKMSLAEYTSMLAEQEYVSEDEVLDNIERQMDWALRTFAEKAKLEVMLRDRTGVKIAQERKRLGESMENQRARETMRRARERDRRREMAEQQRQNRELRELQQKTLKQLQWLNKNRYRAPGELQKTWDEILGDIDIYAVSAADEMHWSAKHQATWRDLADMYKKARETDPNFLPSEELKRIVMRLDGSKIEDMDPAALADLYKAAVGLRTEFYNRNNVINDEQHRLFSEVYTDAKGEIGRAASGYTGKKLDKFLNMEQLTPMNFLERMGGWDTDGAWYSMARQLEQGEREMRDYRVKAERQLEDFLREHEEWAKKADGQGKDAIWYELEVPELLELGMGDKPIFGDTVKVYMTPAQKVHMYLESKNYDNLRHMAGGRTFADKDLYSKGERAEAFAQGRTVRLAPETVKKIVSDLTPEEQELAKVLEDYYNNFAAKKINEKSNILYGYDKAVSKNYAPIYTNRNYVNSEIGVFDTTAEGVGNLKARQYSKNPSYNIGAFDAFERHIDQTARFVGMAIPARNWQTLLNYREQNNSMGDVITHKWGEEAKRYITDLLTTLQGGGRAGKKTLDGAADKLLSNYVTAVFGANPGIVFKQAASFPQFAAALGWENAPSVGQMLHVDENIINAYTSELAYRQLGYATPETAQLKNNPNFLDSNKATRFLLRGGAITAMDAGTVKRAWPWAENKVRREYPELEVGTEEQIRNGESPFYRKVAEEFENAVSMTQPMYDEMHRPEIMKNGSGIQRAFTMFKTVPLQQYNSLRRSFGELQAAKQKAERANETQKPEAEEQEKAAAKKAGAAVTATLASVLMLEAVEMLNQLAKNRGKNYRNDEGELTAGSVGERLARNATGDLAGMVIGGDELTDILANWFLGEKWYGIEIPGGEQLNDIIDAAGGAAGTIQKIITEGANILANGGDLGEYFRRNAGDYSGAAKELAEKLAMYLGGLPVQNVEKYILGAVQTISPELYAGMEDIFDTPTKNDLKGLSGDALATRADHILKARGVEISDETAAALAELYEAGQKTSIPPDTPSSITVNGEDRNLNAYQRQTYDLVWSANVERALDDLTSSGIYRQATPEEQAKMIDKVYDYAAEKAKGALFDDYEAKSSTKVDNLTAVGIDLDDAVRYHNEVNSFTADHDKDGKVIQNSKRDKVFDYIDGLQLTLAQKDALALDAGYSQSTIDKAPWNTRGGNTMLPRG